jgi:TRAP-type C4-dicarboxylate transport system permease small subunit
MFFRAVGVVVSVLEVFCTLLMVTMAVIVLLGVFYRYVIERALPWYDEFAEYLLVWLTFYGSILAAHRRAHIGFETLTELLPERGRRAVALTGEAVVLLIQVALYVYGLRLVEAASFDTALSIRSVRLSWVYSAIPIAGAFMFLISLRRIAALVMAPRS